MKKYLLAGAILLAGSSAPVIPVDDLSKTFLMAQEIKVQDHVPYQQAPYISTTTQKLVTPAPVMDSVPAYADTDGDGYIYVATFDSKEGTEYKEITKEQYRAMGEVDGSLHNPKMTTKDSLFEYLVPQAHAAISLISSSGAMTKSATGATSVTVAYSAGTGTDRYLALFTADLSGDSVTSVTYAGVGSTQLGKVSRGPTNIGTYEMYVYGIAAPTTNSNNIVATRSGTSGWIEVGAVLLNGANQVNTASVVATKQGDIAGASKSQNITTTVDNSGVLAIMLNDNGSLVASTGDTQLFQGSVGGTTTGIMVVRSTTFPYTPAGTLTMSWTQNATGAWAFIAVAIAPTPSTVTAPSNVILFE